MTTPNFEELKEAAEHEAANFRIDPAHLAGRAFVEGYAIDDPACVEHDDAFSLTEDRGTVLQVSTADVGSFIRKGGAIHNLAAQHRSSKLFRRMLPQAVIDELNFVDGQIRPVATVHIPISAAGRVGQTAITYNLIRTVGITAREADERYFDEGADGPFGRLEWVARCLYAALQGNARTIHPAAIIRPDGGRFPHAVSDSETPHAVAVKGAQLAA